MHALIPFAVFQCNLIPSDEYRKFMVVCSDAMCWQALYFVRLQFRLVDKEVQQMPKKEWMMMHPCNLPKHNNSQVLWAQYMKELWDRSLVQLQHCLNMLREDAQRAKRVV